MTAGTASNEAEENATVEDLLYGNPASSKASSSDSGIDDQNIVIDDQENGIASYGTNSSNSYLPHEEPHEVSLVIHITEEKCRLTFVDGNGNLQYYMGNKTFCSTAGSYRIPLKLGVVRHKVFVFGEDVDMYLGADSDKAEFLKAHFYSFKLGKYLLHSNSNTYPPRFHFDGDVVHGKVELLMGLFLDNLKDIVMSAEPKIKGEIKKILVLVPLAFTSFHRQRIKDSAHIAGFKEIFIVNETDTQTLVHLAAKLHVPGKSLEDLAALTRREERKAVDEMPVNLFQTQMISSRYRLKVHQKVDKDSNGRLVAYMKYPMEVCKFYEKSASGEQWEVGTLQVKPQLFYDPQVYPIVEIHASQSQDGIFCLESVRCCKVTTNRKRKLDSECDDTDDNEFTWLPANLGRREKKEFTEKLKEIRQCSITYQKERNKAKDELYNLFNDIFVRLWSDDHNKMERKTKAKIEQKWKVFPECSIKSSRVH